MTTPSGILVSVARTREENLPKTSWAEQSHTRDFL
jgi:hypothetical protein